MTVFSIEEPVYKTGGHFIVNCSFAEMARYLKRRFDVDAGLEGPYGGTMFTFNAPPYRVVWCKSLCAPTLLHEVFHLTTRILHDRGITIRAITGDGENGDEAAAYLFEFFSTRAVKRIGARRLTWDQP